MLEITGAVTTGNHNGVDPPLMTNRSAATIVKTGAGAEAWIGNFDVVNDGTIRVLEGVLTLAGNLANLSGTTLTGGTWEVRGGSRLSLQQASIATNDATIILGQGSDIIERNGTSALESLETNNGSLVLDDVDLAPEIDSSFTNNGTLALHNGSMLELWGGYTQAATARLEIEDLRHGPRYGLRPARRPRIRPARRYHRGRARRRVRSGPRRPVPRDRRHDDPRRELLDSVEGPLGVSYDSGQAQVILSTGGSPTSCNVEWDGEAGDGRWDTAANWSTDAVPGPADWACIPEGSTANHATGTSTVARDDGRGHHHRLRRHAGRYRGLLHRSPNLARWRHPRPATARHRAGPVRLVGWHPRRCGRPSRSRRQRQGRSRTPSCWPVTCSTRAAWSGSPDRSVLSEQPRRRRPPRQPRHLRDPQR